MIPTDEQVAATDLDYELITTTKCVIHVNGSEVAFDDVLVAHRYLIDAYGVNSPECVRFVRLLRWDESDGRVRRFMKDPRA
jgi:hypothetical protein